MKGRKDNKYYKDYIKEITSIAEEIERNNRNNELFRSTKNSIRGFDLFKLPKFEDLNFKTA